METIKVRVGKSGKTKLEALNFKGGVCEQTLNELLVGVGGVEESQTEKPEYYDNGDGGLMDEIFNNNN